MHTESQVRPGRSFFQGSSSFSARPALVAAMLIAAALFCFIGVGQSSGRGGERAVPAQDDHTTGISRAAIEEFWTIYHGNDYAAIPEAQEELQKAIQSDPNNPTLYALLGATHFWHVGELTRDPNWKAHQNVLAQDMPTAASLFQRALDLDYYSPHPIGNINDDHLPGYLGITNGRYPKGQRAGHGADCRC